MARRTFGNGRLDHDFGRGYPQDHFEKGFRVVLGIWVAAVVVSLGVLGFVIWVIVQLLQHFGII